MTGRRLGDRYELVERIGAGGMAEVWRATDHSLGRDVAVKLLHPHLAQDESVLARFRIEAQSAARLTHPGIVSIFDTVTTATTDAIVMELVTGDDLRSILDERGTLAIEDAVEVTMQLAQALGHAHQHGIIHRDVKPANVIVRPDRRVKLSDFGIAKALGDTTLTDSGSLVGTVKYLAPEQIEGGPIDGRADLYSLSIVLFEMVCGRPPFPSTDLVSAMDRIKFVAPRARTIRPDIPQGLDEFLARSLARDPNDRPADALTYAASLAATLRRDNTTVAPSAISAPRLVPSASAPHPLPQPAVPKSIPMRAPTPPDAPESRRRRRRTRDLVWPALAGSLMIAALVVVWILLRPASNVVTERLNESAPPETSADSGAVITDGSDAAQPQTTQSLGTQADPSADSLAGATTVVPTTADLPYVDGVRLIAFDPQGDNDENNDRTGRALDGNPATFWPTQTYNDRQFGQLPKDGVGLIIELEEATKISAFTTLTNRAGWSATLYEADSIQPTLEAWGEPIATYMDIDSEATLEFPDSATNTWLLLWITDLGELPEAAETPEVDDGGPSVRLELFELGVVQ